MDRSAVTRRVWELAEPLVLGAGLELVDVQYRPEGGRQVLRLLIDRVPATPEAAPSSAKQGVTLEELARISRELGDVLDAHDAVSGRYQLECSSPGLDRPLLREEHFRRALGQLIRARTHERVGDRRQFRGTLVAVTAEGVTVRDPDAGEVFLPFAAIERANTEYDFARPGPSQSRGQEGRCSRI
jgi:ribosome maturation factor RimP